MKAMKAKKAMKKSTVAKGKMAKSSVFKGTKSKTSGGLKASDLVKSKSGKIVSKKASASAKKKFQGSKLQKWCKAVQAARKALGVKGFVAIKKGSALYNKAKSL